MNNYRENKQQQIPNDIAVISQWYIGLKIEVVARAKGNHLLGNLRTTPRATTAILVFIIQ